MKLLEKILNQSICANTGCLKKNGPRYNFAIDDPNEKNYTGNEMALKTLQIYPFMGNSNFYFSNGNL
jgi:hypothetical protein